MKNRFGALPDTDIKSLIRAGFIKGAREENINPASLDLAVSEETYRLEGLFLPRAGEKVKDLLKGAGASPHDLEQPLERNVTYLAKLYETLELPQGIYGYCNPKSSTGRNHIHARLLADGVPRYDALTPAGYCGELWIAITPKSFSIKISKGLTLNQLRLFNGDTRLDELEIQIALKANELLWDYLKKKPIFYEEIKIKDNDGSLILTPDLNSEIVGYECRGSNKVLDFSKKEFYRADDFFEPIFKKNDCIYLKEGGFYIISTKEAVVVPPEFACEMWPTDHRSGEFRVHYAGFVDPGWGFFKNGEIKGNPLTLEVKAYEDLIVREGQPIAKIKFERMISAPEKHYGEKLYSNYTLQNGPTLSKHFLRT
ncbi:MAG: 2'-deoxycytidine 5'-triphosphate deaminase [Patescibacteria group bacterium]